MPIHDMPHQFVKLLLIVLKLVVIVKLPDHFVLGHDVLLALITLSPAFDEADLLEKCQELLHRR